MRGGCDTLFYPFWILLSSVCLESISLYPVKNVHAYALQLQSQSAGTHLQEKSISVRRRQSNSQAFNSSETHEHFLAALDTMQHQYFNGCTWPAAIDWTAAVTQTYLASAMITLSSATPYQVLAGGARNLEGSAASTEALIERYFKQINNFYYAQHAQALTAEAYDDMQWVVLGWLEAIKFIDVHSQLHYQEGRNASGDYLGKSRISDFAHRARLFYDLASQGYSTTLCGGGMDWNPNELPYKNAITNELYIASSVGMYLYFPGDDNPSPSFIVNSSSSCTDPTAPFVTGGANATVPLQPVKARDPVYLNNAVKTFDWLTGINMTNTAALYTDGFHISNYNATIGPSRNDKCDQRDEALYSYNQGVFLSGIRGLWEATSNETYLNYGHNLINATITSTGYFNNSCGAFGCAGILADTCDAPGNCSQDAQTFKGAYFHHLMLFCSPLLYGSSTAALDTQHAQLCANYTGWIERNAAAAFSTRNATGNYGMWWGPFNSSLGSVATGSFGVNRWSAPHQPEGAVDYRNDARILSNMPWGKQNFHGSTYEGGMRRVEVNGTGGDVNDRGRGRTVETQGGAVALFNALLAVSKRVE
ncbi:MAG: hypothetical protein M1820_001663 [Bogoriella megaspora]|nr:MAG: hypothetical protein M1820_001663 [Bogoriella megaspora]